MSILYVPIFRDTFDKFAYKTYYKIREIEYLIL